MQRNRPSAIAGRLRRMLVIAVSWLAASLGAGTAASEQAAAPSGTAATPAPAAVASPSVRPAATKPLWRDLPAAQQQTLAPLASVWDELDATRKNKWLAIGNKYATMAPDEQQRVQARMREWVALTPEQRRLARESYARARKLGADRKSAHWEDYQQLPEEQKKQLAAGSAAKKPVAALPPPTSQGKKTLPPIKSAPAPVLERSVTPQATRQPSAPPFTQSSK